MIQKSEILAAINDSDNNKKTLLLKLYRQYIAMSNENEDVKKTDVRKTNIKLAYDRIKTLAEDKGLISYSSIANVSDAILEDYNNLDVLVRHLDETFENQKDDIAETITRLEVLLKLPVTFPQYVPKVLNKVLSQTKGQFRW